MDKEARRKIISEKSVYVRKPKEWNLLDDLQFRWIKLKLKKATYIHYNGVRPRVITLLEKYGYKVSYMKEGIYRIKK